MKRIHGWVVSAMVACAHTPEPAVTAGPDGLAPRLQLELTDRALSRALPEVFEDGQRIHLATDRPLYRPGETVWLQSWTRTGASLLPMDDGLGPAGMRLELVDPRGQVAATLLADDTDGVAHAALDLPASAGGGLWVARAVAHDGTTRERRIAVVPFEAPRVLGDAEFLRDGYGAGDEVVAFVDLRRPTGEPLADQPVEAVLLVDGAPVARASLLTDAAGKVRVSLLLPDPLAATDALLSVTDGEGGSVIRPVPVAKGAPVVAAYPEGGELVAGLPSRVYLEALDPVGEPVDVTGEVLDDLGERVATFEARRGRARFSLTPEPGRRYRAVVTHPQRVEVALPEAATDGCVLQTREDVDGRAPVRVRVRCTEPREVVVIGSLRGELLDAAKVAVPRGAAADVELSSDNPVRDGLQGVVQVTLTDDHLEPLAERLVYRNRGRDLRVEVEPDVAEAVPGQQVGVTVRTLDPEGRPVPATVLVSAVDDTWIAAADDDERDVRSALLLEPSVGDVDDPASYLDAEDPDSAEDLDRLLGTRGFRRFERVALGDVVLDAAALPNPAPVEVEVQVEVEAPRGQALTKDFLQRIPAGRSYQTAVTFAAGVQEGSGGNPNIGGGAYNENVYLLDGVNITDPVTGTVLLAGPRPVTTSPSLNELDQRRIESRRARIDACFEREAARTPDVGGTFAISLAVDRSGAPHHAEVRALSKSHAGVEACLAHVVEELRFIPGMDRSVRATVGERPAPTGPAQPFATVRAFPTPAPHKPGGVRQDLRGTIAWAPALRTGRDGRATTTLVTSDAVTGFRIVAEGVGASAAGRGEALLPSRPPLSATVRTPAQLVDGDDVELAVILDNATDEALDVVLGAETTGPARVAAPDPGRVRVGPHSQVTAWLPMRAEGPGEVDLRVTAATEDGALVDTLERHVRIAPRGFPRTVGQTRRLVDGVVTVAMDTRGALPGTLSSSVQLAPGPSGATEGLESMAREPGGCFEQTSASSYPNVLVLSALQRADAAEPADLRRIRDMVQRGVKRLRSFETPSGGFEWFGREPGHIALTAYGLLQFTRTAEVAPELVEPSFNEEIARWLLSKRDGRGGFTQGGPGLDRFGSAPEGLTNAYTTWALTEAGFGSQVGLELGHQAEIAAHTDDPYELALATLALLGSPDLAPLGQRAAARLMDLQAKDGSFPGAATSITHSGGTDLVVETTALAARALAGADLSRGAGQALAWLAEARRPEGSWGSTQATVLALEALLAAPSPAGPGDVFVRIDGRDAGTLAQPSGLVAATRALDLAPGRHDVVLRGPDGLPATVQASFWTLQLPTDDAAPFALDVSLADGPFAVGDPVRLTATVRNDSDVDQYSPVARLGIPAGLSVQPWQLEDLIDHGVVASVEVVDGTVVAYWDGLAPGQSATVALDLLAEVAGTTAGDASAAWPYYTSDARTWAPAVVAEVARP